MLDALSFYVPRARPAAFPANENALGEVRPLTGDDMNTIIEEHGEAIGAAIDDASDRLGEDRNKAVALVRIVFDLPDLQRWIVWYGTDLKRAEVESLHEDTELVQACFEVMRATYCSYTDGAFRQFFSERLKAVSKYVASGGLN